MYSARISSRKAQVRTKLWTMNPIQRLKLYIAIPSIARHVPLIRSPRYLQAHVGEVKDLSQQNQYSKKKQKSFRSRNANWNQNRILE